MKKIIYFIYQQLTIMGIRRICMIFIEIDELEHWIKQLRKEMIQAAEGTGLNSYRTIYYSQKLDQLITIYQKLSYKKETRKILLNSNEVV
jgi:stage 0 sporulation regulatory protein